MAERPALRLVEDPEDPQDCSLCGEPATTWSAADHAPLCMNCFTETHWHPSWHRSFDDDQ